jgi:hypothetical protein
MQWSLKELKMMFKKIGELGGKKNRVLNIDSFMGKVCTNNSSGP